MGKKNGSRKQKALAEIAQLKGRRRAGIIKIAAALCAAIVFVLGERMLEIAGVLPDGNLLFHGLMLITVVVVAAALGNMSMKLNRISTQIKQIAQSAGLSSEEVRSA